MLQLFTNNRQIKLPLLDRHPNNDQILYSKENYVVDYGDCFDVIECEAGLDISNKTRLHSVMVINTEDFVNAVKSCEVVGSGVYKLEYDRDLIAIEVEENDSWIDNFQPPSEVQDTVARVRELEKEMLILKMEFEQHKK